jgi:hypothetical protein
MSGVDSAALGSIRSTGGNETEGWVKGAMIEIGVMSEIGVVSKIGTLVVVTKLWGRMVGRLTVRGVGERGCV